MSSDRYVAAAYVIVLAVVLAWILLIALKLSRIERELGELERSKQE
jgi:hypothetical protein